MNKNAERYYVEQLQKHYPGYLPEGSPRDSEEPDFLLDHEGTVVGLEVTQLFKAGSAPFPEKEVIAFQRKAVSRAGEMYRQLHPDRPIYFSAYFHNDVPMSDLEACARTLADLAFTSDRGTHRQHMTSPKWLSVWTVIPEAQTRFVANGSSDGALVTHPWMQAEIERKNRKVATYRKNADRVVLLLVSSLGDLQSTVYAPRDFASWQFQFDFDEVLFLFEDPGEVFRFRRAP